ncbi:phage tail tip lysozyme [Rhodobacter capsulatus]|uniref:phage tail tip lysozyme n=1 Tax=Rhodobacter capsulatus TaxID=1061 RepID=UPI004028416A
MSTQTQLEIMLRVVADQARRELGQAKGDVQALTGAARDLGAQAGQGRDGLAVLGVGAAGAGKSLAEASVAALDTSAAMSNMMAAAGRGATSLAGVQNAVTGLTTNISAQVTEMLAAQRETAAWQSELDQLRARFNPLFAASKQYEMTLREIAEAEKLGALSANEAAAARDRAAQVLTVMPAQFQALGASSAASAAHVANLGYQFNDIAMMLAAGQNPVMLMMQQGSQVTQVFDQMRASGLSIGTALRSTLMGLLNPANLATMAVIGIGAAAVQWFVASREKAKSFEDALADLEKASKAVQTALKDARTGIGDLTDEFGDGASKAREMNLALLTLARAEAAQAVKDSITGITDAIGDVSTFGVVRLDKLEDKFNLTNKGAVRVKDALDLFRHARTLEEQQLAAERLAKALADAEYNTDGASDAALAFGTNVARAALEALRVKGYTEQADKLAQSLAKAGIADPFEKAADAAKRLADETMRALQVSREWASATAPGVGLRGLDDERGSQREGIQSISKYRTEMQQAGREILRTQAESLGQLQVEASLIGQSEETRRRTLALYEAELQIRERGISPSSGLAADIRQNAVAIKEFEAQIDRVKDGWKAVERAGEDAIDGVFDALNQGDIGGALEKIASEIGSMFEELAIKNPLKNAILGTNYATLGDVGGLQGIWDRFTGKGPHQVDPSQAAAAAMRTVASMNVTAATVIIGGAGVGSLAGGIGAAGGMGGLQGSEAVQKQVWSYFSAKGLKPHQVAAIMGNVQGESSFNPIAGGDIKNGVPTSFGLFQHHGPRAAGLLDAIGGRQNLGNVQGQLDYAWRELNTTHSGALAALKAAPDVSSATNAWMRQFERPSDEAMQKSWATRLGAAEQAMAKFGTTTTLATGQLGTMGTGFDKFGQALGSAVQGGGGGGFWGTLFSGIMSGLGIPGFAGGGNHAGGLRIVGEDGPELEYTGPSTIVPADLTRRILTGGAPAASTTQIDARPVINITNNSSVPVQGEVQETTDSRGQRRFELVMADAVASGLTAGGGRARRTMRDYYGVNPVGIAR